MRGYLAKKGIIILTRSEILDTVNFFVPNFRLSITILPRPKKSRMACKIFSEVLLCVILNSNLRCLISTLKQPSPSVNPTIHQGSYLIGPGLDVTNGETAKVKINSGIKNLSEK